MAFVFGEAEVKRIVAAVRKVESMARDAMRLANSIQRPETRVRCQLQEQLDAGMTATAKVYARQGQSWNITDREIEVHDDVLETGEHIATDKIIWASYDYGEYWFQDGKCSIIES